MRLRKKQCSSKLRQVLCRSHSDLATGYQSRFGPLAFFAIRSLGYQEVTMLGITDYLYRLVPANPILLRVVETGGKRKRDLLIRCGYLALLIVVVIFSLYGGGGNVSDTNLAELAKTSVKVFQNLSFLQLGLVALLSPIFTAGSITQEKDSQTYDILLATPLSNGQIVLGSLLSRLFFVVMLLVSGIPIFAITQIFGGVAIDNIFVSFLIAAATAFVTGSLAMAIATFKVGTRRTIFSFYFFIVIYLVGLYFLDQVTWFHPIIGYTPDPADVRNMIPAYSTTSWLTGLNPFSALQTLFADQHSRPPALARCLRICSGGLLVGISAARPRSTSRLCSSSASCW